MSASLIAVVFRLLLLRAGPQDLPYAPQLTSWMVVFAITANTVLGVLLMPLPLALLMSAISVGASAVAVRGLLNLRQHPNRFNQTFNALLATGGVMALLLAMPMRVMAPVLEAVRANPELAQDPEALMALRPSLLAHLLWNLLFVWNFVVYAHIVRQASGLRVGGGLMATITMLLFIFLTTSVCAVLIGSLLGIDMQALTGPVVTGPAVAS